MSQAIDLSHFDNSEFDRGASRLKEGLWILVRGFFFLTSFPLPSGFRVWLLKQFGASVGEGVVIRSRVNISFPWRVSLGDNVWIGEEVLILSLANVTIRSNVCLSQRAFLCTGSHDFKSSSFDLITKPITINEHSWIAAQAFIGPGVEIPKGTMVGAGEVVSEKNYPKATS